MDNNLRYEKKFLIPNYLDLKNIFDLKKLKLNEVYDIRKINNIYFDNIKYSNFFDNVDGYGIRKKFRLRWYNNDKEKFFEIKKKINYLTEKKIFKVNGLEEFDIRCLIKNLKKIFKQDKTSNVELSNLMPTSFNTYFRKYFLISKDIRVTYDYNLEFNRILNSKLFKTNLNLKNYSIIEIKYPISKDFEVRQMFRDFDINSTKFSKYIMSFTSNY
jgi:hypothetical protein